MLFTTMLHSIHFFALDALLLLLQLDLGIIIMFLYKTRAQRYQY